MFSQQMNVRWRNSSAEGRRQISRSCDLFAYQGRHFAGKFGNFAHTGRKRKCRPEEVSFTDVYGSRTPGRRELQRRVNGNTLRVHGVTFYTLNGDYHHFWLFYECNELFTYLNSRIGRFTSFVRHWGKTCWSCMKECPWSLNRSWHVMKDDRKRSYIVLYRLADKSDSFIPMVHTSCLFNKCGTFLFWVLTMPVRKKGKISMTYILVCWGATEGKCVEWSLFCFVSVHSSVFYGLFRCSESATASGRVQN